MNTVNAGWIEAIAGCMGAGKTEELARRVRRAQLAGRKIAAFGYRFPEEEGMGAPDAELQFPTGVMRVQGVSSSSELAALISPLTEVLAIDDAQFFDLGLSSVLKQASDDGKQVIVAGLDLDFLGHGFGPMPDILAQAEEVTKLHAVCRSCGSSATRTQRLIEGRPATAESALLGSRDEWKYEPRCRACHLVPSTI